MNRRSKFSLYLIGQPDAGEEIPMDDVPWSSRSLVNAIVGGEREWRDGGRGGGGGGSHPHYVPFFIFA